MVVTQVNLPEDLKNAAYIAAEQNYESYSSFVRRVLRKYLSDNLPDETDSLGTHKEIKNEHLGQTS